MISALPLPRAWREEGSLLRGMVKKREAPQENQEALVVASVESKRHYQEASLQCSQVEAAAVAVVAAAVAAAVAGFAAIGTVARKLLGRSWEVAAGE